MRGFNVILLVAISCSLVASRPQGFFDFGGSLGVLGGSNLKLNAGSALNLERGLKALGNGLTNAVDTSKSVINAAVDMDVHAANNLKKVVENVADTTKSVVNAPVQMNVHAANNLKKVVENVADTSKSVVSTAVEIDVHAANNLKEAVENVADTSKSAVNQAVEKGVRAASGLQQALKNVVHISTSAVNGAADDAGLKFEISKPKIDLNAQNEAIIDDIRKRAQIAADKAAVAGAMLNNTAERIKKLSESKRIGFPMGEILEE